MILPVLLLWISYLAAIGVVVLVLRWLGRPMSLRDGLILGALPIVFCLPAFFGGRTPIPADHVRLLPPWSGPSASQPRNPNLNDVVTQLAPWSKAVRVSWKEGSLPLRNRWNGCGSPLAANGQSGGFSPFTFAAAAVPLAVGFSLAAALKLWLSLAGMRAWLRELGVSPAAALFGSVSFAFSMTLMPWLLFPLSGVFCLWPWALFAAELLRSPESRTRAMVGLTAVFAAWILVGHPESAVLGGLGIGLFLGARILLGDRSARSMALRTAAAGALAAALTAFLWVPELAAVRASNRYPNAEQFRKNLPVSLTPHWPAWRYGLWTSLFPRTLGDDIHSPRVEGSVGSFSEMALGHFGIVGWSLVLLVLRPGAARARCEVALLAVLLIGLGVGTATWPLFDLFFQLPLLRLVLPLRFLSWVSLAGPAVAALEADRLLRDRVAARPSLVFLFGVPAALAAAAILVFIGFRRLHVEAGGLEAQRGALTLSLVALAATAGILGLSRGPARIAAAIPALLAALAGTDLLLQESDFYRWGSPAEIFPKTPLVRFLEAQKGPFRIVGEGPALFPGTNVFAGVEDIRTHDPLERRDYVDFLTRTCGYDTRTYFKHVANLDAPVLDFLNVRFLVTGDSGRAETARWRRVYAGPDGLVFENRRVLPPVFAPRALRVVPDGENPEIPLPTADWNEEATILDGSGTRARAGSSKPNGPEPNAPVEILDYREKTNAVRFTARSMTNASSVVVASLMQDGGWTAQDERGRPVRMLRANGLFLGLKMDAGRHEIRLDYVPPGFRGGAAVSLAALPIALGFLGWRRMKRGWSS